jgi:hypothetical protein
MDEPKSYFLVGLLVNEQLQGCAVIGAHCHLCAANLMFEQHGDAAMLKQSGMQVTPLPPGHNWEPDAERGLVRGREARAAIRRLQKGYLN